MKIIRHHKPVNHKTYDSLFYGYEFKNNMFFYFYSQSIMPKDKNDLFNTEHSRVFKTPETSIHMYDFYKEIQAIKPKFIKDGECHLFPDLEGKLGKILNEDS